MSRPKETPENAAGAAAVSEAAASVLGGPGKGVKGEAAVKFTGAVKGEVRLETNERVEDDDLRDAICQAANALLADPGAREELKAAASVSILKMKRKGNKVDITFAVGGTASEGAGGGAGAGAAKKKGKPQQKQQKQQKANVASTVSAVDVAFASIVGRVAEAVRALGPDKAGSAEALAEAVGPDVMDALHALHNRGYSNGLSSRSSLPGLYIPKASN